MPTTFAVRRLLPVFLVLGLAVLPARGADDDETTAIDDMAHVTIIGTAETDVAPDLATITVGVETRKPSAREASDASALSMQQIIGAAKAQGVAARDITTEAITLVQAFDDTRDEAGHVTGRHPAGFDAADTLSIKVRELAKAGALAQTLIDRGANRFDGITFSLEHAEPVMDRLAAEAITNAKRRAQQVANAAGIQLGRILLIEKPDAASAIAPPVVLSRSRISAAALPVEAGTTHLAAAMAVTWAIRP